MNRLGTLLISLVLCVGTAVPLTGAAYSGILTIVRIADESTITAEVITDSGMTVPLVEEIAEDDVTDPPIEKITDDGTTDAAGDQSEKTRFSAMLAEAEKHLGIRYVWGGTSPSTGFDCSGFVSWVLNHSGWDIGRLGAQALYDLCASIPLSDAQPGDLVFFTKTYRAPRPVTHVGIFTGDGTFIHCGTSTGVTYSKLNNSYWQKHYYGAGKLPTP